jgi:hypothetical protein
VGDDADKCCEERNCFCVNPFDKKAPPIEFNIGPYEVVTSTPSSEEDYYMFQKNSLKEKDPYMLVVADPPTPENKSEESPALAVSAASDVDASFAEQDASSSTAAEESSQDQEVYVLSANPEAAKAAKEAKAMQTALVGLIVIFGVLLVVALRRRKVSGFALVTSPQHVELGVDESA